MATKKVSLMDFQGNPNIGIYMFANDKFCLIGQNTEQPKKDEISKALNVPVYETTVLGTGLIGIFTAGNNEFILVPEVHEYEFIQLQEICNKHDVKIITISNRLNTLGNNICVGSKSIILNDDYDDYTIKKIKEKTGYKVILITSQKFRAVGATFKFINNKFFISQEYEEQEVKQIIKEIAGTGTVNKGGHYISSGIVGNSNGLIIGSASTSVEIQNIVESLDYL